MTTLSPATGPTAGNTTVTVLGSGFTGATGVSFGATPATGVTVVSDNKLTATAPAGTATQPVTVTTATGTSSKVTADQYVYAAAPTVTSIAPLTGSTAGGTLVTIRGSGFTAGSTVAFGSTTLPAIFVSSAALRVDAPPGTGAVDITVTAAGGKSTTSSSDRYTYVVGATGFGYNGDGLRMTEQTTSGTVNFTWDSTPSVPQLLSDGTGSYIYGPGGTPIEQIDSSGNPSYFFHDAIGSTRALLSPSGAIQSTFTYGAYGSLTATTGSVTTPLLFAGGYLDASTGEYYLIHRYYDPTTGAFFSVDPMVNETNAAYGYAAQDPVNGSDPSGLICFSWHCVAHTVMKVSGAVQVGVDFLGAITVIGAPAAVLASEIAGYVNLAATCAGGGSQSQCSDAFAMAIASGGLGTALPEEFQPALNLGNDQVNKQLNNQAQAPRSYGQVAGLNAAYGSAQTLTERCT